MNFCAPIFEQARLHPDRLALQVPFGDAGALRYGELMRAVAAQQARLRAGGLSQGDRILLFLQPGITLYVTAVAMLALGMVPVMIERGMPRSRLREVLRLSGARAVIGERAVMRWAWLYPALWRMRRWVADGVRGQPAGVTAQPDCVTLDPDAEGIVTYTTGSTGVPKGANRTHGSLRAQHLAIRAHWSDRDDDIDLPSFPVLVLHNLCCGISTVLPDTDLSRPGQADAARVLDQIRLQGVTRLSGSPAYLDQLTRHAAERNQRCYDVRAVAIGGSTLTQQLARRCRQMFPRAEIMVVYGSTEAEPISHVDIDELIRDWDSLPGQLVGTPASHAQVCIVSPDSVLQDHAQVLAAALPTGADGEVLVAGPHVLKAYVGNEAATRETKVPRPDGHVWHRTGDTGCLDPQGRLWLSGRVKDRVMAGGRPLAPYPLEKALDALPGIERAALIAHNGRPLVVTQGQAHDPAALQAVLARGGLAGVDVAQVRQMPVDGRHNSKLDRATLRQRIEGERMNRTSRYIVRLNPVDWLTLSGVLTSGLAVVCALDGHVMLATSLLYLAMLGDALDGMLARRFGLTRHFGRYLDGFMDVLIYLVAPSLVFYLHGFDGAWSLCLLAMLGAGCTRLSVFNEIGNVTREDQGLAYLGMPVFWSLFILAAYLLAALVLSPPWVHGLLAVALLAFSRAMVWKRPFFKFKRLWQILLITLGGSGLFAWLHFAGAGHV